MARVYEQITTSFKKEAFEDIFEEIKQQRPDLSNNSEVAQEALRVLLRQLRDGKDPLAKAQMASTRNSAAAGSKKVSGPGLERGTWQNAFLGLQFVPGAY